MSTAGERPRVERIYTPQEVAQMFRVDPKTVTRWARAGRIPDYAVIWTIGGHRRYKAAFIDGMLASSPKAPK